MTVKDKDYIAFWGLLILSGQTTSPWIGLLLIAMAGISLWSHYHADN